MKEHAIPESQLQASWAPSGVAAERPSRERIGREPNVDPLPPADTPSSNDFTALSGALRGADLLLRDFQATGQARTFGKSHPSLCAMKRVIDLIIAISSLLVFAPVLGACALLIRLDSDGPILFRQRRVGRCGQSFSIFKFRTMKSNAAELLEKHLESDLDAREEWNRTKKLRNDPRVTRIGQFMRKFSLDELPQLWNVLIGEMSCVGPRPIQFYEIPMYDKQYPDYCCVRPGLTGLWQVSGRSDTSYRERVSLDSRYVRTWSQANDLRILALTVPAVLKAAGAY